MELLGLIGALRNQDFTKLTLAEKKRLMLSEIDAQIGSADAKIGRLQEELASLKSLRAAVEAEEGISVFALTGMLSRAEWRFAGHNRPKTNADVLLELISMHGPLKVTAMVDRLREDGHRLASAANPLKAVSNELAIMRRRGMVVRLPDGAYDDAKIYEEQPF